MKQGLGSALRAKQASGLYRRRRITEGPQGVRQVVDGQQCLSFCSNDYLGLANHAEVVAAFQKAAAEYGVGSGASHLINGHSLAHHRLEEELADFVGRPKALLFSTGYMANLGVVSALLGRGDRIFQDRLNHASLIDAAVGSPAKLFRYPHLDLQRLESGLRIAGTGRKLVMTDGVFSMDGDLAPLPRLQEIASEQGAWLMVDDAHGFGVLGQTGRGIGEHFQLEGSPDILMCTLGKAAGTFGAFVAGDGELIETLIQGARTYLYTTALPPAVAAATSASLALVKKDGWRREKLRYLIRHFRSAARQLGLRLLPSETPIQPLLVGEPGRAVAISDGLLRRGYLVTAIRPPTVPEGSSRLRITLCADHEEQDVDQLLDALDALVHGLA